MTQDWLQRFQWTLGDVRQIVAMACSGLSQTDIDDLFQQTCANFTEVLNGANPPQIESEAGQRSYIYTIARNLKNAFLIRKRIDAEAVAKIAAGLAIRTVDDETPEELLRKLSDGQREAIMALLPDDKRQLREVMRLRFQGLSRVKISKLLGLSPATMTRRLDDSLHYLKPRVSEIVNHPSAAPAPGAGQ